MKKDFDKELAELWEACTDKLFDKHTYVNRLEELLRNNGITEKSMILDVAGGFGFPAIELAKRGYQIVYSDGSQAMLERAMRNADLAGAPAHIFAFQAIGYSAVPWQEYAKSYGDEAWNALICKGNSLPYAVSWGKEKPDLTRAREQIKTTLSDFFRILVPGGILYVDKQPEAQDQAVEDIGEIEVDGRRLYLTCSFNNDKVRRIRNWTLTTKDLETGEEKNYPSQGYLLLEDELVPLLEEVGFSGVRKHVLEGDIYEAFIAKKPEEKIAKTKK